MNIKRYLARDMRYALRQVRDEQGPDAVILSTRELETGIELIAAVDYDRSLLAGMFGNADQSKSRAAAQESESQAPLDAQTSAPAAPTAAAPTSAPVSPSQPDASIAELRREVSSMRGLLRSQLSRLAWGELSRNEPFKVQCLRRLLKLDLSPRLARAIVDDMPADEDADKAWRGMLHGLARRIPVSTADIVQTGGRIALVGPTGIGKTATLAKLAVAFARRHGTEGIALISMDVDRVGAQIQLKTYARILEVPVYTATPESLARILGTLAERQLVLIDTAGVSPRAMRLQGQFRALLDDGSIQKYLAVPANAQRTALDELVRAFGTLGLAGGIVTKLDEAVSLGAILSVAVRHHLALAYVTEGQRVPEDLHPARVTSLVTRAVSLAAQFERAAAERTPALPSLSAHRVSRASKARV